MPSRTPGPAGRSVDCTWRNGFFAGGYGDLSVVPDRSGQTLYLFFSSHHPAEDAQGVAVLRLSTDTSSVPPLWWTAAGWKRSASSARSRYGLPCAVFGTATRIASGALPSTTTVR